MINEDYLLRLQYRATSFHLIPQHRFSTYNACTPINLYNIYAKIIKVYMNK